MVGTAGFARSLHAQNGPEDRLEHGVGLVVDLVAGCDHASVTMTGERPLLTPVASDEVVRRGDDWQLELGEGPCLDAMRLEQTVLSQDLGKDPRWPRWSPRARCELGIHGMLSVLLFTERDTYGSLNLYADRAAAFGPEEIELAHSLAVLLAVAVSDAREIANRGLAMDTRTVIGQAEGILMERFGMQPDHAFAYLRRISQNHHRKLGDVAAELVATRRLPEHPGGRPVPTPPRRRPPTTNGVRAPGPDDR